jgi:hypothetical protein
MMLLGGGPDLREGVGLGAQVMGESVSGGGVAELVNMEGERSGGTVGRWSCDEGIGVGVGQMEVVRKGARAVFGVRLRRRLWWK